MKGWKLVLAAALAATVPALATSYVELVPWTTLAGTTGSTGQQAAVVDGQTSYHQLSSAAGITKVTPLNGAMTTTTLLNSAQWFTASNTSSMTSWYGFSVSGNYVQFTETSSDQVWRVDKGTGAITAYATKANIMAATGLTTVALLSPADTNPAGEMVFYEGNSDSVLVTAGANNVQVLLSSAQLTAATGNADVSGGLGVDAAGNLYWGTNTSDDLWRRNADGTIVQVLTAAQIMAVSGGTAVSWKDIFAAPDGFVYFGDNSSKNILRFSPADPVGTLQNFLTSAELVAGPMGTDNMVCLSWYDPDGAGVAPGGLAFHSFNTSGINRGLYWVPEPAALALLALGALLRRR